MIERVPVPLPLMGLSESIAADQQELGTTARALNVRGVDPRTPGRIRLAQRSGLEPHGSGAQVASGSAVVTMFHGVRDTPPESWVENGSADVTTGWTTTVDAQPVAATLGPDGNCYTLLSNGSVTIHSERGRLLGTIDAQVPTGFSLVHDIGVDEDGAVYTMASFALRVNGGAGRLYRHRKRDDFWEREEETVIEWRPRAFIYDRGEILLTAARPDDWDESAEADGIASLERLYRYSGVKGGAFGVWFQPAASPAVALAANERGDILVASSANPSRTPASASTLTPQVDWVPREATVADEGVDASKTLYMHLSALRAQDVQGLADDTGTGTWVGATHDASDFPDVLDVRRDAFSPSPDRRPLFDRNGMAGVPGMVFNGARAMGSGQSTGFNEKTTLDSQAPYAQSLFPNMRNATGQGAHFLVAMLFRIEAVPGGHTTIHYVFEQGDYALSYERNGSNIDFIFDYPGGTSTLTVTGLTARTLVFSFVHAGNGDANSAWYLYDATTLYTAGTLTVGINRANERTAIGAYAEALAPQWVDTSVNAFGTTLGAKRYEIGDVVWNKGRAYTCIAAHRSDDLTREPGVGSNTATFWTVVAKLGLEGAIAEAITFLGGTTTTPHDTIPNTTLRQTVEGYIANAYGKQGILTGAHPHQGAPPAGAGSLVNTTSLAGLNAPQGITAKYARTDGRLMWVLRGSTSGSGVAVAPNDYFYVSSTEGVAVGAAPRVRRLKDEGLTVRTSGLDLWQVGYSFGDAWPSPRLRITVDHCGDLYVPWVDADATENRSLRRYAADGTPVGGFDLTFEYELGSDAFPVLAVPAGLAIDERDTSGPCGPEFVFVPSIDLTPSVTPSYSVRRVEVVRRVANGATSPREIQLLAVTANGTVSRYASGAWSSVAASALPGDYVWTATLFGKTFLGNGKTYRVYDHANKTLRTFDEATLGRIPPRCRLGVAWRGRMVIARGDSAHDWYMSATADPFDWEFQPDIVTETQAVSGASSQVGEVPDLINTLVPWSDDLLLFGCDTSIWRLTGDPMASGELHRVSDITGMAFGASWCKDPEQRVYFWGSRGGLYGLTPDGSVQPLSEGRIHRRLQDIDLARYTPRLVWNDIDQGVHVFFVPVDGRGEPTHYFFERKTGAFWADQFHGLDRQVRGVFLSDGDLPSDRVILLGGADGRIRKWSSTAADDDGEMIRSSCLIGPLSPETAALEMRLVAVEAMLARDQGGCMIGVEGTREADVPYHVPATVQLNPGRNGYSRMRARGSHLWIEIAGSDLGQTWAIEDMAMHVASSGRKR